MSQGQIGSLAIAPAPPAGITPVTIIGPLPIPVTIDNLAGKTTFSRFFQVLSVAGLVTQTITTQVISEAGYTLKDIEVSGQNKATYRVYINNVLVALKRTYYTHYNENFSFPDLPLAIADTLKIEVTNDSNSTSDFETRIMGYKD